MRVCHKSLLQAGFTLIEMMMVVVILGVLISIALVNMQSASQRAHEASIRTNMHSFHNLIELYAVDFNGFYPINVNALLAEPIVGSQRLLSEMKNPYTSLAGFHRAYDDESATKTPGLVTYQSELNSAGRAVSYVIYGYNHHLELLKVNNRDFILSNN